MLGLGKDTRRRESNEDGEHVVVVGWEQANSTQTRHEWPEILYKEEKLDTLNPSRRWVDDC